MGTAPEAEYDSLQINKIEGRQKDNGTFLHFHEAPGTFIGKVCYESFIITLFFDLSSLHMQPGIIAGDEVKYNPRYVTFPPSVFNFAGVDISTYFAMLIDANMILLLVGVCCQTNVH